MMRRLIVAVCWLWATTAQAQTIFRMDDSGTPNAGWPGGAVPTTATHDRVPLPTGGPTGGPAWEFRQRYAPQVEGYGGEFYWGWNGNIESSDPPQGARRYYRWRLYFDPATNWRGLYWQDGRPITITNKILMVGDGCGRNRCRIIVSYRGIPDGSAAEIRVALDGGDSPTPNVLLRKGQWLDIQIEADSSTTTSSADGAFKLWLNSDTYAAPTAQITGIQLNPTNWRYVFFGAYNNNGLAADGAQTFRVAGFEAAASFDATFHGGGAPPPPPPGPVDCAGAWSAWLRRPNTESACVNGSRTFIEFREFGVTVPPANGGAACPSSPELRTQSEACSAPPPPTDPCVVAPIVVSGVAWPGSAEGTRSGRFTWAVANTTTTLRWVEWLWGPQRLRVTDARGCAVTVTR